MEDVLTTVGIIGAIIGFIEWRFRVTHSCTKRIETNLTKHLDETKQVLERFYKLEQKVNG